jgi:hypothetical protein
MNNFESRYKKLNEKQREAVDALDGTIQTGSIGKD